MSNQELGNEGLILSSCESGEPVWTQRVNRNRQAIFTFVTLSIFNS